jgi:hypothetical protein
LGRDRSTRRGGARPARMPRHGTRLRDPSTARDRA